MNKTMESPIGKVDVHISFSPREAQLEMKHVNNPVDYFYLCVSNPKLYFRGLVVEPEEYTVINGIPYSFGLYMKCHAPYTIINYDGTNIFRKDKMFGEPTPGARSKIYNLRDWVTGWFLSDAALLLEVKREGYNDFAKELNSKIEDYRKEIARLDRLSAQMREAANKLS